LGFFFWPSKVACGRSGGRAGGRCAFEAKASEGGNRIECLGREWWGGGGEG
jgi:hypothetical protein